MKALFEKFKLNEQVELRNRLVMAPMTTYSANEDDTVSDEEITYYKERAEGAGMIITACAYVAANGKAFPGQIAAHEEVIPVPELYKYCEIAREICNRPEYRLGRIIARPFIGTDKTNFKRTPNRHDLALSPTGRTAMDDLKDAGYETSCVGKISDIFNNVGVTRTVKTVSNSDGMQKTLDQVKNLDFTGLCFTNLVDFDALWGHRRNPQGYAEELEKFDVLLGQFLEKMKEDDLVIVTADHGNDPTFKGTDHTKERVPFLAYSPSMKTSGRIDDQNCFAVIGATIADNFGVAMPEGTIGTSILKQLD